MQARVANAKASFIVMVGREYYAVAMRYCMLNIGGFFICYGVSLASGGTVISYARLILPFPSTESGVGVYVG